MKINALKAKLLDNVVEIAQTQTAPILTGEENLTLEKQELINKVFENEHAKGYMEVIETEASLLVGQGLFKGYFKDGAVWFDIPDYDRFISAVEAFYTTCYAEGCEE